MTETRGVAGWHVAVLIPARDEEDLLPRCLKSVAAARARLPRGVTSDVIIVSDSSSDETVNIARTMLHGVGAVVETWSGCVGIARAVAADVALSRYTGELRRCWLANTDADCEVPDSWLVDQLSIACRGYAAVAGIVDVKDFSEHLPSVEQHFRTTYRIESDGTHHHVHGANLGVRADAYVSAGGWNPLETAEDHDLWNRLCAQGHALASDARLQVMTSGRRLGRAPMGFAAALSAHNDAVLA